MKGRAILIVDDDPYLCTLLTNVFERLQFQVECANSLNEALQIIGKLKPFLVLLDHYLPDGKGLNLINNIKKKYHCRVIVMSADPSPFIKTLALKRGADDYIEKPFKGDEISNRVLEYEN
ncbi:MAG TPA: response regulator [Puia sp.]|jgi:two-component system response regulator CitB